MPTNTNSTPDQNLDETSAQSNTDEAISGLDKKDETKSSSLEFGLSKPRRTIIKGSILNDQGRQSTIK